MYLEAWTKVYQFQERGHPMHRSMSVMRMMEMLSHHQHNLQLIAVLHHQLALDASTGTSLQTCAANLVGVREKGTSSQPAKKDKTDRNLMDALDRMIESNTKIGKLRIEATIAMHKDNLVDRQEQRKTQEQ